MKLKSSIYKTQVEAIIKRREDSAIEKVTAAIIGTKIKNSQLLYS